MKKAILIMLLFSATLPLQAQECLNVKHKLRGYFYAGSSQEDSTALGGFYEDANAPKVINERIRQLSKPSQFQMIVQIDSLAEFQKGIKGFKVFLVNSTNSVISLEAQDSRLNLKRQVFYNNQWLDVEYLPSSWCGNSYHSVFIKPGEYWDFTAPCLKGKHQAKFRFELAVDEQERIYSNEFSGSFNKRQLIKEQGHTPTSIMDPYDN
ncbi:hypothetical protein [Cesiribacter sp. SM1]|uniref:hypothetical protein n=1 Tax=Cesiribacter sp. SM1 TaxID=2861196 RepID=UPI001CD5BA70|nr:hypothetical protein [Cesiribacter sp. SM1]